MLHFSVLASGSKANCIYVQSKDAAILIDCGLSAKRAAAALEEIGVAPESIDAIVVSHEHSDHVRGVRVFSKRFSTRIIANRDTLGKCEELRVLEQTSVFSTGESFEIASLRLDPFSLAHDAADPVGFRVTSEDVSMSVVTDLGYVTECVREGVRGSKALVLEVNYERSMLDEAPYPWSIKQRIASRQGHLSNENAGAFVEELSQAGQTQLQVVVAAHISENSNTPERAVDSITLGWRRGGCEAKPEFLAASPKHPTKLFQLN